MHRTILAPLALAAAALAGSLAARPAAAADYYAFGVSRYDGTQALVVNASTAIRTRGRQGWVSADTDNPTGGGPDGNTNYVAGSITGAVFRDYFLFGIGNLRAPVTSLTLTLDTFDVSGPVTFRLRGATGLAASLYDAASPDAALYAALGTGTLYGTYDLAADASDTIVSLPLTAAAVADLAAAAAAGARYFALAGTIGPQGAVPEPGAWLLTIAGCGVLGRALRTRRAGAPARG